MNHSSFQNLFKSLICLSMVWQTTGMQAQTCDLPASAAVNIVAASPTTLLAEWATVENAAFYEVTAFDGVTGLEVYSAIEPQTLHEVTGLLPDHDYEVCVKAACLDSVVSCNPTCALARTTTIIIEVIVMSQSPLPTSTTLSATAGITPAFSRASLVLNGNAPCGNKYCLDIMDRSGLKVDDFDMSFPALGSGCYNIKLDKEAMTVSNLTQNAFRLTSENTALTGWSIEMRNFNVQANVVTFEYKITNAPNRNFVAKILSNN